MPYEWLLIALPVAFISGWLSARLDIRHIRNSATELPRACLRGVAELLGGSEEKALDAFSDIAHQGGTPPSELQFTIAELSRRRGDYRRALKTHQQLYANERLSGRERNRALWEMAKDCAAMGFVDSAEQYAKLLAEVPEYADSVFDFLLKNYQIRHRYDEALALIKSTGHDTRQLHQKTSAQLYCELAQRSDADAGALLGEALAINPACARAQLELAQRELESGSPQQALQRCNALADTAPQYLWLAADSLLRAHAAAGTPQQGREQLLGWVQIFPSPMLFRTAVRLLDSGAEEGEAAGCGAALKKVISDYTVNHGSSDAAACFIEQQQPPGGLQEWLSVKNALLASRRKAFVCKACDYEMNHFSWQCPCCLCWESLEQQ